MIHNVTEGLAIAAPLSKSFDSLSRSIYHVVLLGLIAGAPTIVGTWIGGFSYSPALAVLFLAIGAGAAVQVILTILQHMKKHSDSLVTLTNTAGLLSGLLLMYLTGFFVV